ncbi:MAG: ribosome-binding factor A [Patescibacteria group bacterium]|jgi:ribosome-binding factor A
MSQRAEQLAEIIRRELDIFLIKEAEVPRDMFITITEVVVTDDLENSFIKASVLPVDKSGTALAFLKRNAGAAARYLSKQMVMRKVPKLDFKLDDFALKHRSVERALNEEID